MHDFSTINGLMMTADVTRHCKNILFASSHSPLSLGVNLSPHLSKNINFTRLLYIFISISFYSLDPSLRLSFFLFLSFSLSLFTSSSHQQQQQQPMGVNEFSTIEA